MTAIPMAYVFPAAMMANTLSVSGLMILLGLTGNSATAADFDIVPLLPLLGLLGLTMAVIRRRWPEIRASAPLIIVFERRAPVHHAGR